MREQTAWPFKGLLVEAYQLFLPTGFTDTKAVRAGPFFYRVGIQE